MWLFETDQGSLILVSIKDRLEAQYVFEHWLEASDEAGQLPMFTSFIQKEITCVASWIKTRQKKSRLLILIVKQGSKPRQKSSIC